ncbi:MAG: hypothetical protein LBI18_16035 [Planctomycetaceae bacterium]|jgi:hypothetical protein|nr:hypothetical protein [Planctomycetaceae bacterium]
MERHLFDLFYDTLIRQGLEEKEGCAVDGTFVDVPKQHNSHTKNEQLKQSMIPEDLTERGFSPQICEKRVHNHPLTPLQRFCNRIKSHIRCRIEHIFGAKKKWMGDEILRTIRLKRA